MGSQAFLQQRLFGGASGGRTRLQTYLYANNNQVAEAAGDHVLALKTVTLDALANVSSFEGASAIALTQEDIVKDAYTGVIDAMPPRETLRYALFF